MAEKNPSWKDLHLHQKLKYLFEIVAILGGLTLLWFNYSQLKLLSQSNEINRQMFSSSFPLEIESKVVGFVDENPLLIKLRLTNIVGRRMQLETLTAEFLRFTSEVIEEASINIRLNFSKQGSASPPCDMHDLTLKIVLQPSDSCFLELCSKLDIRGEYSEKNIFKPKPLETAFIIVPLYIESYGQYSSRIILLTVWRDQHKSLVVTSEDYRRLDKETLTQIMRIERAGLRIPEWE